MFDRVANTSVIDISISRPHLEGSWTLARQDSSTTDTYLTAQPQQTVVAQDSSPIDYSTTGNRPEV